MACLAIGIGSVVKVDVVPVVSIVAVGALAGPVARRMCMACLTITIRVAVLKLDVAPVASTVAVGALAGPVARRLFMA